MMNKVARYCGIITNNNITKQPGYIYVTVNGMAIVNELHQVKQFYDINHMPQNKVYMAGDGIEINDDYITVKSDIARVSDIPTKTSQLTNDSNFIVYSDITSKADLINGKIPASQLPSYVDDIIEGYIDLSNNKFYSDSQKQNQIEIEENKIYLDLDSSKMYRFGGTTFGQISASLALGETASTAFPGNRGKSLQQNMNSKANSNEVYTKTQIDNKGYLTEHQDISNKLDDVTVNKTNEIITALATGKVSTSGKKIGDETLGYTISGDTLTNNIKIELGINDQNFSVFIGRHNGGTIYPNFDCDLIYLHTNGYALHRYLQNGENTWKTYKSDNATDGIFKYNITEENPDGVSAQLLIDQLPTEYGIVGSAGTDEKNNNPITGSFILKIKTLSDNITHEFEVGLIYSDKIVATEKAVKDEIKNSLPTKLSQFTNDVPYLTKTCLPFPDELQQYAYPDETITTLAFCQAFADLDLAKQGRIYLGQIGNLSDMPFAGNAECMITVCEDDVFTLEMFSTNIPMNHWIATYPGTVGDDSLACPWKGNLTCSISTMGKDTQDDVPIYTPIKDYDGTTKKYVDDKIGDINTILDSINGEEL